MLLMSCDKPKSVQVPPQTTAPSRPEDAGQPRVPENALQRLTGQWDGELEYLDFGDKQSKSRISATMKCDYAVATRTVQMKLSFREPGGKIVEDKASLALSADGSQITFDDAAWKVTKFEAFPNQGSLTIGFEQDGTDNERQASLKNTLLINDGERLLFTKEVRYKDGGSYFVRSTYRFNRIGD